MLPMPQMFPMPFTFLMFMVSALFLLSVIRTYWQCQQRPYYGARTASAAEKSTHFSQVW